jgi:hypothetical protein
MEYLSTSFQGGDVNSGTLVLSPPPPPPFQHHLHHNGFSGSAPPYSSNHLILHHRQHSRQDTNPSIANMSIVGNMTDMSIMDLDASNMTHSNLTMMNGHHTFDDTTVHSFMVDDGDLGQLSLEIEKERNEYMEKSKLLVEQLKALKNEIDELKVEDKMTPLDIVHLERQEQGNTKYSTIQKVKRGSTQSRVAFFEEL